MRKILLLSLLSLAACQGSYQAQTSSSGGTGNTNSLDTIVGGKDVDASSPLARIVLSHRTILDNVSNQSDSSNSSQVRISQCSASALTKKLVLTAAHCVHQNTESVIEFLDAGGSFVSIPVKKATVNEDFLNDKTADLAILTLAEELPDFVQPITLPDESLQIDLAKTGMTAAGYGRDVDVAPFAGLGTLRATQVKIAEYSPTENSIVVDQTDGQGICQGDSGGPGLVEFEGKTYALGVASKTSYLPTTDGSDPHMCHFKGTYVNLVKFKSWVEKTVAVLQKGG